MEVDPYDAGMAAELASAYSHMVRDVPHCYPVDAEDFASALALAAGEGEAHDRLHSAAAFVARKGGAILGFVHAGIQRPDKDRPDQAEQGVIRFLCYKPGHRAAGQALLEAAEAHLREHKITQIAAFPQEHRYRFYHFEHAYLSDSLGHVGALLGFNGYRRVRGEVFMDWRDYDTHPPSATDVSAEISPEWNEGRGARPGLTVHAYQGEKQVGICRSLCGGEFSRADDAQGWLHTVWLWVADELQGRGLGRHLLQRALAEMRGVGYRHAAISTNWENYRAFLFYTNCGYRVADWTYSVAREIA